LSIADVNSDDYSFGPEMLLRMPSSNGLNEQAKEDTESPLHLQEEVAETLVKEIKAPLQEHSIPLSTCPDARTLEEPSQKQVKVPLQEHSIPQAPLSTRPDSKNEGPPPQKEVKVAPRQHSIDSQRQEARISTTASAQQMEEPVNGQSKGISRDPPSQKSRMPSIFTVKSVDEPQKVEVNLPSERKLNPTTSFPKTPREDVKSSAQELHVAPRVVSSEMIKDASQLEKEETKLPTVEVKAALSDALTTTEDEDVVVMPQNFKIRKSKKRFSAKY
jgi:hypothetical protein